ncbi:hypothetical protein [Asticcacaulis tiandongensis]|uniref:hypothetical protein n=1 Tax=Asticcacaulis tiandongensis TaxID=2565365 RepID=UPI001129241D|nr:hypothetical protein [Asticcacaulis tiandongensis]
MSNDPLKALFEADATRRPAVPAHDPVFQMRVLEAVSRKHYRQQQVRLALSCGLFTLILGLLAPYLAEGFAHIAPQQGLMVTAILITLPSFILLFRKGLKL